MPRLNVNYFLLPLLFSVSSIYAAEQGEWGETSTAYTTIQISILPNILITDVTDIVLDINDRTQDVVFTQEFCVVGNTNADYVLIASGAAGEGSPFELVGEDNTVLPYEFSFNGDLAQPVDVPLESGIESAPYELENVGIDCNGSPNARFSVTFRSEDLILSPAGLFSGAVSLTVATQ
ncbi:hypothetical protein [Umboniibacter marinipuniceus]|uniref:Uncharacterized protein n=1 Tax=Umboniibacter marinipuniceus TaxID=569599 RepID=A0A3M0AAX1_9GAMM|nr:hypothetical protein [Umboniibacter marinipuniceus]RMA81364.1 hypothetical protein DFR27_1181 [Umboniibacter marinipuniceus]